MLRWTISSLFTMALLAPGLSSAQSSKPKNKPRYFLENTDLVCIYDGIQDVTRNEEGVGENVSTKYLSALAAAVQLHYRKNQTIPNQANLQKEIIQRIQAYGYCLGKQADANGNATNQAGYGDALSIDNERIYTDLTDVVTGRNTVVHPNGKVQKLLYVDSERLNAVFNYLGFENREAFVSLLGPDGWSSSPVESQRHFQNKVDKISRATGDFASSGKGLNDCFKQLKAMQTDSGSPFNLTENPRPPSNVKFCQVLANKCGIKDSFCSGTSSASGPIPASGNIKGRSIYDKMQENLNNTAR